MKHHKYYNTIWTNRDQEFYWDGVKTGAVIPTVFAILLAVNWGLSVLENRKHS